MKKRVVVAFVAKRLVVVAFVVKILVADAVPNDEVPAVRVEKSP